MALRLRGSTSGYAEIDAPAVAGDVTLTLPSTTGTINVKDASGNTEVGTGVTFGNPSANIFTIDTNGSERLRIAADGTVSIPGALNVSGVLTYEDVTSVDAIGLSTFRDGLNTKDVGLNAISSTDINSDAANAVDVFIYDTSKDSDGGEWRKRTQHTSWYNETLNTAIRGSRKEFPAVAVIVVTAATTRKLYIYDGDDPDLPMWMVIDTTDAQWPQTESSSLYALNGVIALGSSSDSQPVYETRNRLDLYYFVSDKIESSGGGTGGNYYGTVEGLVNRQTHATDRGSTAGNSVYSLVNLRVNDVAMTVLPNAPIDSATGLPIPTIAVATNGGVSVIKDDGKVYDLTQNQTYNNVKNIKFIDRDGKFLYVAQNSSGGQYYHQAAISKLLSNDSNAAFYSGTDEHLFRFVGNAVSSSEEQVITTPVAFQNADASITDATHISDRFGFENYAIAYPTHLTLGLQPEPGAKGNETSVAFATTSYNTGWMHGDCKGAFLSDTSTTNATYTTVADDWATAGAWTKQSSISVSSTGSGTSGTLSITGNGTGSNTYFFNPITVEANTDYVVSVTFGAYNANDFFINTTQYSTSNQVLDIHGLSGLTRGGHFNSGSNTTLYIQGYQVSSSATTITNIVIQKVSEKDRSVNNKGLQVFGTIDKDPVAGSGATAAELVAYSGFSNNTDYLAQPYNSDLNFGTDDFSVTWWMKYNTITTGSISQYVYDRRGTSNGNRSAIYIWGDNNGSLAFYTNAGSASELTFSGLDSICGGDNWTCFTATRHSSGLMEVYANGRLQASNTYTVRDLDTTDGELFVGIRYSVGTGAAVDADYALLRFSKSIPSAEQIKKIYEDERVLFQENAAATLYGSSDAVTALAYDEVTDQLHVGTSSGRSNFQGLRRINNTTTAVTTAISAHDTFIIEQ